MIWDLATVLSKPALWAQITDPGGDVASNVAPFTSLGLSAVFLWQWRDERRERRETQATMNQMVGQFGGALKDAVDTLVEVRNGMAAQYQKAADQPDRRDLDLSIRRLELLADELTRPVPRRRESSG